MNIKRDYTIHSFAEYIEVLKEIQAIEKTELWYRGQRLSNRHLDPTLYRSNMCYETDDGHGFTINPKYKTYDFRGQTVRFPDQYKMLEKFKTEIKNKGLSPSPRMNDLEWLCFSQHCGMPTSLLDWSEDPLVGLFFAVCNIQFPIQENELNEEAIVFVLNPSILNANSTIWAYDENGNSCDITYPIQVTDSNYQILVEHSLGNNIPVCIKPRKIGYRMCRQSGNFMLYGTDIQPIDMRPKNAVNTFLYKIRIPYSIVEGLKDDLNALNITKESIYGDEPELDDVGKQAKEVGKAQIKKIVQSVIDEYNSHSNQ